MFFSCETKPQGQVKEKANLEGPGITLAGFCSMHLGGFTVKSPERHLARHWSYIAQNFTMLNSIFNSYYKFIALVSSHQCVKKNVTDLSPLFLLIVALRTRYITHLQRLLRLDEVSTWHKERDINHIYRVWFVSTRLNAHCFIQFAFLCITPARIWGE